jgi:hypothetical protein
MHKIKFLVSYSVPVLILSSLFHILFPLFLHSFFPVHAHTQAVCSKGPPDGTAVKRKCQRVFAVAQYTAEAELPSVCSSIKEIRPQI